MHLHGVTQHLLLTLVDKKLARGTSDHVSSLHDLVALVQNVVLALVRGQLLELLQVQVLLEHALSVRDQLRLDAVLQLAVGLLARVQLLEQPAVEEHVVRQIDCGMFPRGHGHFDAVTAVHACP